MTIKTMIFNVLAHINTGVNYLSSFRHNNNKFVTGLNLVGNLFVPPPPFYRDYRILLTEITTYSLPQNIYIYIHKSGYFLLTVTVTKLLLYLLH